MKLSQPYYIEKRGGSSHFSLNGDWDFCWEDHAVRYPNGLSYKFHGKIPHSVYHLLHTAGVLPDPYKGINSRQYQWVDEKVWYFRRKFLLSNSKFHGNAFLCFEGVSYYSRVWVNENLLGEHEGAYAGPCIDIADYLNFNGENEIVVEVKACNYGSKEGYDFWNKKGENTAIVPWNIVRDSSTSNGDFIVLGIWNDVRIEFLPFMHLSRPYLYTESVLDEAAFLHFEVEIADGTIQELRPYFGMNDGVNDYTRAFDSGLTGETLTDTVTIEIEISATEESVYYCKEEIPLCDFRRLGMDERYWELQFYCKDIVIKNPKLWYPNGLGEAFLYDVKVTLSCKKEIYDTLSFQFGIRTFAASHTKGPKYRTRWDKYLFSVNGQEIFLKGMNWMPIDYLYDISPDRYEWCLTLAKNAGIQLLRVWNGGGIPETDTFYELCDRLGIMVWQDEFIANTNSTAYYPQDVLECQIAYNLYRIRNHSSLVIICGGNEFNPYSPGNAASMFVTERTVETLVPDRVFYYTTADKGSAHIYIDMEPVWYRHRYKHLPFLAESGIHSFPTFKTLKRVLGAEETDQEQCNLSSLSFQEDFPELLNHFSEYLPERVPRMMARNSQILDLSSASLQDLCVASQVQVYEFYQLMIQAMRENYPICGGIMPWTFKRPWPTVGAQLVDGDDRPGYGYYAVQNAYRSVIVCWCQEWSVLAPNEELSLVVKVFGGDSVEYKNAQITLTVYAPDLSVYKQYESVCAPVCDFGKLALDETFTNTCFLVCADLSMNGKSIHRSVYFNKCTNLLSDFVLLKQYRTVPMPNLYFSEGPWLKPAICNARRAKMEALIIDRGYSGKYTYVEFLLKNTSDVPAFPVTIDTQTADRCMLSENFFLLKSHEEKIVRLTADTDKKLSVRVDCWNADKLEI